MTTSTSNLVHQLKNMEKIIYHMLKVPNSSKFCALVEKKVNQFEELIAQLPESEEHLAEAARVKVVSMYSRLYNVPLDFSQPTSSEDSSESSIVVPIHSASSGSPKNEPFVFDTSNSPKSKLDEIRPPPLLPTPSEPPSASSSSDPPKRRFDLDKCILRYELEDSIAHLSPIESGDLEAVKKLLVETANARTKLEQYPTDTRLHSTIFNMVFNKLPLKMRDQFLSIYGFHVGGISLENLVNFLQAEIVAQTSKTASLVNKIIYSQSHGQGSTWQAPVNEMPSRCKYCKTFGHVRNDCPWLKVLLCFRCYRSGHSKRTCPHYTFC